VPTKIQLGEFTVEVWGKDPDEHLEPPALPKEKVESQGTHDSVPSPNVPPKKTNACSPEKTTASGAPVEVRRQIHKKLLAYLDLPAMDRRTIQDDAMRARVVEGLRRVVSELGDTDLKALDESEKELLVQELSDEVVGLGPLEELLADVDVNEIMVVDPHTIFVERRGKIELSGRRFTDDDSVRAAIERIVTPLGRRIDESTPLVDARLKDGSRVNAVIPPLALKGPCITIRKFAKDPLRMDDLVGFGSVSPGMAEFLKNAVRVKRNIVISGGTGSGKTTLLNVLSGAIPADERVVTVEDAAELQLAQPHVVSLESRPPNLEGKGEYTIRDLVKNALRMRPDRIVVGECRGGEALDMLQAMNTGHEGSLTTTHANSPKEAVARIETLCLMAGLDLPIRAIRQQIASSIHLIVQQTRFSDGSRRVKSVAEVIGIDDEGEIELREIYTFKAASKEFLATGYIPSFVDRFIEAGLIEQGGVL
jgi:pilus assembly protein CpaF